MDFPDKCRVIIYIYTKYKLNFLLKKSVFLDENKNLHFPIFVTFPEF